MLVLRMPNERQVRVENEREMVFAHGGLFARGALFATSYRAARTAAMNSCARFVSSFQSPFRINVGSRTLPTAPTATAPARNHSATFEASTPLVGMIGICGSGPRTAFKYSGPNFTAGKIFTMSAPKIGRAHV